MRVDSGSSALWVTSRSLTSASRDAAWEEVRAGRVTSRAVTGASARLLPCHHQRSPAHSFWAGRFCDNALQSRSGIQNLEPGEGFEPPTRALRKRCSLYHVTPHSPEEPHFISENRLHHPTSAQAVTPSADKLVGKLSATVGAPDETLGPAIATSVMTRQMP